MLTKFKELIKRYKKNLNIQLTISISFTILSVLSMCFLSITLYANFAKRTEEMSIERTTQLLNQTAINLEDYLRNMRQISDAMYYSVIKDKDLSVDNIDTEMNLLYEANKDSIISIACYTNDGRLVAAAPVATQKSNSDITGQKWFKNAMDQMENLHFSTPHVQNLFDDTSYRYYWVISLSRAVELTSKGNSRLGVLLVDMNYSSIEQLFSKANTSNSLEYLYLIDDSGEIIYHPKQKLIYTDFYDENNIKAASYDDGSYEEEFNGEKRLVTVKRISYTGWKIVSVVPMKSFSMGLNDTKYFVVILVSLSLIAIITINQLVSAGIAKPLKKLNNSVKEWESGNMNPSIYIGGPTEVEHLGKTLSSTVKQIDQLMKDIVVKQEEKRKSELDALQSQINPHFLYNTLDSVVWMIEGEKNKEAVFMITQLASLFRISLSKGKTIISIEDEIKHAKNYMNIQLVRYKNKFSVEFDIEPDILKCCTVKLIVQPILENAIYYGMEYMDGEGEIRVHGYKNENDVFIDVEDNGLGMRQEEVDNLLIENEESPRVKKHGSGVGLINVNKRIKLRFGEEYGLEIESVPDEGTRVRIHIPYILYEENTGRNEI